MKFYMECWDEGKTLLAVDLDKLESVQLVDGKEIKMLVKAEGCNMVELKYGGEDPERGQKHDFNKIRKEARKFFGSKDEEEVVETVAKPEKKAKPAKK